MAKQPKSSSSNSNIKTKSLVIQEEIDLESNSTRKATSKKKSSIKMKRNNFLACSKTTMSSQSMGDYIDVTANSLKANSNRNSKETNQDLILVNNEDMHKFYATRLKHSLIIRFLLLVPIQNLSLCLISQFSEHVYFQTEFDVYFYI